MPEAGQGQVLGQIVPDEAEVFIQIDQQLLQPGAPLLVGRLGSSQTEGIIRAAVDGPPRMPQRRLRIRTLEIISPAMLNVLLGAMQVTSFS